MSGTRQPGTATAGNGAKVPKGAGRPSQPSAAKIDATTEMVRVTFEGIVSILAETNRHELAMLDRKLTWLNSQGAKVETATVKISLNL